MSCVGSPRRPPISSSSATAYISESPLCTSRHHREIFAASPKHGHEVFHHSHMIVCVQGCVWEERGGGHAKNELCGFS